MKDPNAPNALRVSRWREKIEHGKKHANPQVVADLIAAILENPKPKLRYVIGREAKLALLARTILPWTGFESVIVKLSGLDK